MNRIIEYNQQNTSPKLIVIGDSKVGKKSLIIRLIKDSFQDNLSVFPLSNSKYILKGVNTRYIKIYELLTQDAILQGDRILSKKNIQGVILLYDISSIQSFKSIKEISSSKALDSHRQRLYIVGNKSDLVRKRELNFDKAKQFADEVGAKFIEISVKTSYNLPNIFSNIFSVKS